MSSNVESLLSAILTGDEKYVVVPQSRVEELLLAIYKNGGGGGGGTAGIKYLGVIDNYKNLSTTSKKGDYYLAGTADKDKNVHVGDMLIAQKDNPSATIDNSNYRLLHTELDTDTTYTITQDSTDKHIFYFKSSTETGTGTKITIPDNDTKTTAASDEKAATKLYLVGTMTQDANGVKTYANAKVYIGTDDCLYSNGKKVAIQEDVDKKANKTSVSLSKPGGETTSVINVTDAKAQMAMVAKISGKTYKRNLIDTSETWYKESSSNTVTIKDSTITVTGTWFCAVPVTVKANTAYSISGTIVSGTVNGMIAVLNKDKGDTSLKQLPNIGYNSGTFNTGSNTTVWIAFYGGRSASGTSVYKDVQLEEGSVVNPYVPFGLISTPVESVVSVGKNMADTIYGKRINSNDGSVLSDPVGVMTSLIPIDPTKTYYVTGLKNTCMSFFAWYDANGNYINRNGGAQRSYLAITPSDVPSNARYIRANQYGATSVDVVKDVKFMMSQSPSDPYVPYNKTTVLVPSAVKNLPDYGLGIVKSDGSIVANEVDFENGVYYHRVGQVDFKDLTFKPASEATFTYYYQFAEAKANSECICAKYTTSLDFTNDKIININQYHSLLLRDTSISSAGAVSTTNSGVKIVYERDSVETKPLTDFIRPLPVENGGTLTLVNEHNLDMPSVIKYKKEV